MRSKSSQAAAVVDSRHHSGTMVVSVADSTGTLRELGSVASDEPQGFTPVISASIEEDVDGPRTARVSLQRSRGKWNFGQWVTGTANPLQPSTGVTRLAITRRVKIESIVTPADSPQASLSGARITIFEGYIDEIEEPGDTIELVCTDKTALVRDTFIEDERVYGYATGVYATAGCLVWKSDLRAIALGELVIPSELQGNGHFYEATSVSSAQGTTEPTWPTGSGSTVVSGGVTFTERGTVTKGAHTSVLVVMQQLLDDCMGSAAPTLYAPADPGWNIYSYQQQRQSLEEALQVFASSLGWSLRRIWNTSTSAFELTLYAPDRTRTTVDKTVSPANVRAIESMSINAWDIRNVVRVLYGDRAAVDPTGEPTRKVLQVSDSASIAKYGRRFMEVGEESASQIDSSGEATQLANAILADLAEPVAVVSLTVPFDPFVEVGDLVRIQADGVRFSADTDIAVVQVSHEAGENGASTKMTLRGKPVATVNGWLAMDGGRRVLPHAFNPADGLDSTINPTQVVGGVATRVANSQLGAGAMTTQYEVHVSDTSGFTPDSSTLRGTGPNTSHVTADAVPGKTQYVKLVPYKMNAMKKARGEPGPELVIANGRAKTGHYDSASTQSHLPLNGNFEHASDDLAVAPPDHWQVITRPSETTETWGSSGSVYYGEDFTTKGRYIELRASATQRGNIVSSVFEVRRGIRALNFYLSIMRTGSSAVSGKDLIVDIFGYADAAMANQVINYSVNFSGDSAGPFPSLNTWYDTVIDFGAGYGPIPSNVNFLQVALRRGTAGDNSFAWRVGDVYAQEADFYRLKADFVDAASDTAWTAVSFQNSFTDYDTANFFGVAYRKRLGRVELRGWFKRASAATLTTIFTLPVGFRPTRRMGWAVPCSPSGYARFDVRTDGTVIIDTATSATWYDFVSIDSVSFDPS